MAEHEYHLSLRSVSTEDMDPKHYSIPVPMARVLSRTSIGISELVRRAFDGIPPDAVEYRQAVAEAVNCLESAQPQPEELFMYGPSEGDYYIELPGPAS